MTTNASQRQQKCPGAFWEDRDNETNPTDKVCEEAEGVIVCSWRRGVTKLSACLASALQKEGKLTSKPFVRCLAWQSELRSSTSEEKEELVIKVSPSVKASHHFPPLTLEVRGWESTFTEVMDDDPKLQKMPGNTPLSFGRAIRERFLKKGALATEWATLTKFSSSFCLIASVYEPSSLVCNSVNRSLSWN